MNNLKNHIECTLQQRDKHDQRFRLFGMSTIIFSIMFLVIIFSSIIITGYSAFQQTFIALNIKVNEITDTSIAIKKALRDMFPDVNERKEKKQLYGLISMNAPYLLQDILKNHKEFIEGEIEVWVIASDLSDQYMKGKTDITIPESSRKITDNQVKWLDRLNNEKKVQVRFNTNFFTTGDSRSPETAGIGGAIVGTIMTLLITLMVAFPIGVASAIYLEELAPKNKWSEFIEVNINNLAAVPSIIFGLLGLAIFLNFFHLPRSAPIVGGLVLALMTLPTIIIASRVSIKSVPPSIREGALALGATHVQAIFHHILPLALPGMMTGTIIGMARALGETAPLLMIGMVAFIVDIPKSFSDPSIVLPVQVFLWANSPERAFVERTSAAIMILLAFLILMNIGAVLIRKRFEKKW